MIRMICRIAIVLGFGRDLEDVSANSKREAVITLRDTVLFSFSPFIIGVIGISFLSHPETILYQLSNDVKSVAVYVISVAMVAPVWISARSDREIPNRRSFLNWTISLVCVSSLAIIAQQAGIALNIWGFLIGSLAVIVLVVALFYANAAFSEESLVGSTAVSEHSELEFTSQFAAAVINDESLSESEIRADASTHEGDALSPEFFHDDTDEG